jgi:UPF0755 protein
MKKLLYVLLVVAVFYGVNEWRYARNIQPLHRLGVTKDVVIEPGSSVKAIANQLKTAALIKNANAFVRYVTTNDLESSLQAGSYVLSSNQSVAVIAATLQNAKSTQMRITIPEGFTVKDIDDLLTERELITTGELINCANTCDVSAFAFLPDVNYLPRGGKVEGYLFPDTYFIDSTNFSAEQFMGRLLQTFEQKIINEHKQQLLESDYTLNQIITMASMVEKESRLPSEQPLVAGILWKRLEEGISLGVDATVRYLVSKDTAPITRTDLDTDSPYNTRLYRGMPPGPIANPGLQTIEATLEPEQSPYYYYLHGNDGQIRYARTNDEHNTNKARYLR